MLTLQHTVGLDIHYFEDQPFVPNNMKLRSSNTCTMFQRSKATLDNDSDYRGFWEYLGYFDLSTTQVYLEVTQIQLQKNLRQNTPCGNS